MFPRQVYKGDSLLLPCVWDRTRKESRERAGRDIEQAKVGMLPSSLQQVLRDLPVRPIQAS